MQRDTTTSGEGRGLSRRSFLKTAAAAGALASVPGVLTGWKREAHAAGKAVRVLLTPSMKITPGQLSDGTGQNVTSIIYDYLMRLEGPEQKLTFSLAEGAKPNADMTQWTVKCREKVKFHHGTAFTAEDVIFTVNRWLDEKLGCPLRSVMSHLEKMEKVDPMTVRFVLKRPDPDFLLKFLDYNAPIVAHDYDYATLGNTKPSGTGAFKCTAYQPGQRMSLEKNKDYWIAGLPKSDAMELQFIPDIQTQLMSLEAGQADIVRWVGYDVLGKYMKHPDIQVLGLPVANHAPIAFRCDKPPFDDVRVRQAMKYVVDRKKIMEAVIYGHGVIGNDNPVWPMNEWYTDIGLREANIEKAKKLLADAGHPKGIEVEIWCANNHPPVQDIVLAYQEMARPAGINVKVQGVAEDVYYSKYWRKVDAMCTNWAHRENPVDLLTVAYRSDGKWNETGFKSAALDAAIDAAAVEVNAAKRKAHFKTIETILTDEGSSVIPFFYQVFAAIRKNVKGFQMTRNLSNDYRGVEIV